MGYISRQIEEAYSNVLFRRHDPDGSMYYFSHEDFDGLYKQDFSFVSRNGDKLNGAFYCYDEPIKDKLIVFDHGLSNGHRSYMREIETLCRHGYFVYAFDHTGADSSEGEHVNGLLGSLADIDDCLNAIKDIPAVSGREIYLIGHSRGGFSSLTVFPDHPEVKKVVALSPFISIKAMHKQLVPAIASPFRKLLYRLEEKHNPQYCNGSVINALEKTDIPVLLIHSLDDKTVSAKLNILEVRKQLFDRENLEFILLNGKGHDPHYTRSAAAYKQEFYSERRRLRKKGLLENDDQKALLLDCYDWYEMTEQDEDVWEKIFKFLDK